MKRIICIISIFTLSSCAVFGMVNKTVEFTTTKCEEFLDFIEQDDFNQARELLHSNSEVEKPYLESYISTLEQTYNIDFSEGYEIVTSLSSFYNVEGDAKTYESVFVIEISSKELYLYFNYLKDNVDEGIHSFYFVDNDEIN